MIQLITSKHSPRWLVLLFDMFISAVSIFSAVYLISNNRLDDYLPSAYSITFVLVVRLISFLISKTYAGVVRYTTIADTGRILTVSLLVSSFLLLANFIFYHYIGETYLMPINVIFNDFFIQAFLMIASRILVKTLYNKLKDVSREKKQVIIYGADIYGIKTKDTLERDTHTSYEVVAFIDDAAGNTGKKLDGVAIYNSDRIESVLQKKTVSMFIFAKLGTDPDLKSHIIDTCLNYHVKVSTVPDFSQWINGELNFNQIRDIKIEDLLERPAIKLDQEQISREIAGNIVLVTGAAGSIGSEIVRQAARFKPKKIVLLDQAESPLYDLELELREKLNFHDFETAIGDITSHERIDRIFEQHRPKVVFHAAAYKHVPMMEDHPSEAIHNNVYGTKIVADCAVKYKVRKFVMISTDKAVNPTNIMGASKRIAEIYAQTLDKTTSTAFITTRFGNVLGSNGSVIPRFKKQIEAGGPVTVTHANITRFFMTIPEACQLVLEAGAMGKGGEIFIFDMGKAVKIVDLAKKMIRLSGLVVNKDIEIKFTGLRPGEKLYEELLADKENTMPTHHTQIMIAKVRDYETTEVLEKFNKLVSLRRSQDNFEIVRQMKALVPEFKSQNSIYEELDRIIPDEMPEKIITLVD